MENKSNIPKVVIIGAGFGGLWAARALASAQVEILILERNNYHTFAALLYQVAAAELGPEDIVHPVRNIVRNLPNVHVEMADVETIDIPMQRIRIGDQFITYDYLILASNLWPILFLRCVKLVFLLCAFNLCSRLDVTQCDNFVL